MIIKEIEDNARSIYRQRKRERINAQLKPCPFCGGPADIMEYTKCCGGGYIEYKKVKCMICGCQTINKLSDSCDDEKIAELWNRRVWESKE